MKKKIRILTGIVLLICSGIFASIGMNNELLGINSELVLEERYLFGVVAYSPYTFKHVLLLMSLIGFTVGVTLVAMAICSICKKK